MSAAVTPRDVLARTDHRPVPMPDGPWIQRQTWSELLFAHWSVPESSLRRLIPKQLSIETKDGSAWLGITPFRMSGVRLRAVPALPGVSTFRELNVRTYVRHRNTPGIWFFSLDADSLPNVLGARAIYNLPYFYARMSLRRRGDDFAFSSWRLGTTSRLAFRATYKPSGEEFQSAPGSLEHWFTERYVLFTADRHGRLYRAEIHHAPWPLQPAEAGVECNTMGSPLQLPLTPAPHLLFSRKLDVLVWPLRREPAR